MLEVEREVELRQSSPLGGGPSSSQEIHASLRIPDERRLPTWEVPLQPLVLYYDNEAREWVIVAHASSCNLWQDRGSPPGGYFEFRSNGSWWTPVPLSDQSVGLKANLLFGYHGNSLPKHVTLDEKQKLQSSPFIDKHYVSINVAPGVDKCAPNGPYRKP